MRTRDTKGRFTKSNNNSDKQKKQTDGGKYKDNKGRWHKSNGKYA